MRKLSDWCNKAEIIYKNDIETYYLRAAAYIALLKYERSYEECTRAKELKLFNDQFCIILGTACVFLEKWSEALRKSKSRANPQFY